MSQPPKTYRIYTFDLARQRVSADFIDAATDAEAVAAAEAGELGAKCEIWHERRLVAQIEGERRQA